MKNLKKLVALAVLMTVSINVTASDFGTWLGAEAEKKVGKFSFELGAGFRAQNNMKSVERWDASFGISYKPFKFLKFAVGYNYIYQYRIEEKRNHYDEYEQAYEDRPSEIRHNRTCKHRAVQYFLARALPVHPHEPCLLFSR